MIKHNLYEEFALGLVFCTYPADRTYDEIIALCMNDELRVRHNEQCESFREDEKQLCLDELYENECFSKIPELLTYIEIRAKNQFGEYIIEEENLTKKIAKMLQELNCAELTAIRHLSYKLQDKLEQIEKDKLEYK